MRKTFHDDGYGDEDAQHPTFARGVLLPAGIFLVLITAVFALPSIVKGAEAPTIAEPLPDPVAQAPDLFAEAKAIQAAVVQVTPDLNPPAAEVAAAFVAAAMTEAGIVDWQEPERMTPAGTQWARLNQRLRASGPSPALKAAFVAFLQRFTGTAKPNLSPAP